MELIEQRIARLGRIDQRRRVASSFTSASTCRSSSTCTPAT
jgi:hypothetical protein